MDASSLVHDQTPCDALGSNRVALMAGTIGTPDSLPSSNDSGPSDSPTAAPTETEPALPTDGSTDEVMDELTSGSLSPIAIPASQRLTLRVVGWRLPSLSLNIEWIERQFVAGGDWSFIASRIDQARQYTFPRGKYDIMIATGRALAKTQL